MSCDRQDSFNTDSEGSVNNGKMNVETKVDDCCGDNEPVRTYSPTNEGGERDDGSDDKYMPMD